MYILLFVILSLNYIFKIIFLIIMSENEFKINSEVIIFNIIDKFLKKIIIIRNPLIYII